MHKHIIKSAFKENLHQRLGNIQQRLQMRTVASAFVLDKAAHLAIEDVVGLAAVLVHMLIRRIDLKGQSGKQILLGSERSHTYKSTTKVS